MDNIAFEKLLATCKSSLERYVYFKISPKTDADDVLQEIYLAAFKSISTLTNTNNFKTWILRIASNKCNDFYRKRAKQLEIPVEEIHDTVMTQSRFGMTTSDMVRETIDALKDSDQQIIYLFYFKNKPISEIALLLEIPIGTVKSRLFTARQNFKDVFLEPPISKGVTKMNKLPNIMPDYKITKIDKPPFEVKWEELMGWFIIPKLGESLTWAIYDSPERKRTDTYECKVIGKAMVHGVQGVEVVSLDKTNNLTRNFVVQLTETHCRILAESHYEQDTKIYHTFLDADTFIPDWSFGEDNCGHETNIQKKGIINRMDNQFTCNTMPEILDVVGRYDVEISGVNYDTICLMNIELNGSDSIMTEQYINKDGRTILWRRFNSDDWAFNRYKQLWSDKLPHNEKITINDNTFVHWYDCITDYIL